MPLKSTDNITVALYVLQLNLANTEIHQNLYAEGPFVNQR